MEAVLLGSLHQSLVVLPPSEGDQLHYMLTHLFTSACYTPVVQVVNFDLLDRPSPWCWQYCFVLVLCDFAGADAVGALLLPESTKVACRLWTC